MVKFLFAVLFTGSESHKFAQLHSTHPTISFLPHGHVRKKLVPSAFPPYLFMVLKRAEMTIAAESEFKIPTLVNTFVVELLWRCEIQVAFVPTSRLC